MPSADRIAADRMANFDIRSKAVFMLIVPMRGEPVGSPRGMVRSDCRSSRGLPGRNTRFFLVVGFLVSPRSTRVQVNAGDIRHRLNREAANGAVHRLQVLDIVDHGLGDRVGILFRHVLVDDEDRAGADRIYRLVDALIGPGRNLRTHEARILAVDPVEGGVVDGDQGHGDRDERLRKGCARVTRRGLEADSPAVADRLCALRGTTANDDVEIILGQIVCGQCHAKERGRASAERLGGEGLALEFRDGGDAAVLGHPDLHDVGADHRDCPKVGECLVERTIGIGGKNSRRAESEADIGGTAGDGDDVRVASADIGRGPHSRVGEQFCDANADRIEGAAGVARDDDEVLRLRADLCSAKAHGQGHCDCKQCSEFLHFSSPCWMLVFRFLLLVFLLMIFIKFIRQGCFQY